MKNDYPIIHFADTLEFEQWIEQHCTVEKGVWIKIYKKATGTTSISHREALDVALCYGWIDGQSKGFNQQCYLQKFTPRAPRSMWSSRNRENVKRLIEQKRMREGGHAEIERAKLDGRWEQAYLPPTEATIPPDLQQAIEKEPQHVQEFFKTLNRSNIYAIYFRLATAKKPETRIRRFNAILQMLKEGKTFH
jgi:uncharacterized protein YdeI (YjbR/CyaY-like superfamily)